MYKYLILGVMLLASASVQAESAKTPSVPPQSKLGTTSGEEALMVYGVTGEGEIPFRAEPTEEKPVVGFFPPHKAVWVVRPQEPWLLVHFKGMSGWIRKDDLVTLFTIDPVTGLPQ